ncbi:MAG TPA: FAD:protein FMN transferase [Streptosporangiaceae bacterium]
MAQVPGAASRPTAPAIHHLEEVMGTIVTIDVFTSTPAAVSESGALREQLARARATLHRADEVFSTWRPDSPVSRLRRGEVAPSEVPAEVTEVLERCAVARELSGGWFDPWAMPGGVDPTGYVKGWAAQRALGAFAEHDNCGAIVNAAGDIASFGALPDGAAFRIGIADPASPRRLAEIVELTGAIATSGTYERGVHLVDPHSGQPAAAVASASVTGPDLGLADALATALAVAGEPGLTIVDGIEGYEALVIGFDGSRQWTEQFPFGSGARHS